MRLAIEQFPAPPGLDLPPAQALLDLMSTIPAVAGPWSRFSKALMTQTGLDPRLRELAILRTAHRTRCAYISAGHIPVARHAGLSDDRIAFAFGADAADANPVDAGVIGAVDDLIDRRCIGQETFCCLEAAIGRGEILELTMLVGQYSMIATVCRSFGVVPERGLESTPHAATAPNPVAGR